MRNWHEHCATFTDLTLRLASQLRIGHCEILLWNYSFWALLNHRWNIQRFHRNSRLFSIPSLSLAQHTSTGETMTRAHIAAGLLRDPEMKRVLRRLLRSTIFFLLSAACTENSRSILILYFLLFSFLTSLNSFTLIASHFVYTRCLSLKSLDFFCCCSALPHCWLERGCLREC